MTICTQGLFFTCIVIFVPLKYVRCVVRSAPVLSAPFMSVTFWPVGGNSEEEEEVFFSATARSNNLRCFHRSVYYVERRFGAPRLQQLLRDLLKRAAVLDVGERVLPSCSGSGYV